MRFLSRLPEGADDDWRYNVIEPANGLMESVILFLTGDEDSIDLRIMHDWCEFSLRLVPDRNGQLKRDGSSEVFRINDAFGVLLDERRRETDQQFRVSGFLTVEDRHKGAIAGVISLKTFDLHLEAS